MQEQKYDELERRASVSAELDDVRRLETRARIQREIEFMKAEGTALTLSDEELKLLESFRRFKLRMRRDGEVFTWQTRRPEGVQLASETAEIVHPSEIEEPLAASAEGEAIKQRRQNARVNAVLAALNTLPRSPL